MEIAIVAGGASLLAITALVGVIMLALKLSDAKDAASAASVNAAELQGKLAIATSTIATKTDEANSERTRANALDAALGQAEQEMAGDPAGALDRLLTSWKATAPAAAPAVGAASGVSGPSAASATGNGAGGVLKPG